MNVAGLNGWMARWGVALCLVVLLFPAEGRAQTTNAWVPTSGSADWNTAANWNPASVPNGVAAVAIFTNTDYTSSITNTLSDDVTVNGLVFNDYGANDLQQLLIRGKQITFGGTSPFLSNSNDWGAWVLFDTTTRVSGTTLVLGGKQGCYGRFLRPIVGNGTLLLREGIWDIVDMNSNFFGRIIVSNFTENCGFTTYGSGAYSYWQFGDTNEATHIYGTGFVQLLSQANSTSNSEPFHLYGMNANGTIRFYNNTNCSYFGATLLHTNGAINYSQYAYPQDEPLGARKDFFFAGSLADDGSNRHLFVLNDTGGNPSSTGTLSRTSRMVLSGEFRHGGATFVGNTKEPDGAVEYSGWLELTNANDRLPIGTTVYLGGSTNMAGITIGAEGANGALILAGADQELAGLRVLGTGTQSRVIGGVPTNNFLTLNIAAGVTNRYRGVLGGAGVNENNLTLTKTGAGTLALSGTNTYNGPTSVKNGVLEADNTRSLGSTVTIDSTGGVDLMNYAGANTGWTNTVLDGSGAVRMVFAASGTACDSAMWFSPSFTGTIELANTGGNRDKWNLWNPGVCNLPSTTVTIDSGSQMLAGGASVFAAIRAEGTGNLENRGAIRLEGTLACPVQLLADMTIGTEGGAISGGISSGAAGTQTLTLGSAVSTGTGTFTGVIGGGTGSLAVQVADGTSIFTAPNTYRGGTTVSGGRLLVNNTSGSGTGPGAVSVTGGTLGGTGRIAGAVTVAPGAKFAAGNSVGTNTVGSLTLTNGAIFEVEASGAAADQTISMGPVDLGGASLSTVALSAPTFTSVLIISNATGQITGRFAGLYEADQVLVGGIPYYIHYRPTYVELNLTPTAVVLHQLGAIAEGANVVVRWRTASEILTAGFDLYRKVNGEWVKINDAVIAATGAAQGGIGASYAVVDAGATAGGTYEYKLVEVEQGGALNEYGPYERTASAFEMTSPIRATAGGMEVRWLSRTGERYRVLRASDLRTLSFEPIATGVEATPPENVHLDTNAAPLRVYRIELDQ